MTAETSDDVGGEHDYSRAWYGYTAIAISFVTNVASMSMVFVALSAMADDFGVTLADISWVVIAQALTISALMLPMGRLADVVGRRRMHLTGLVIFGGGALLVAFAPTFGFLIAARVVMATGNSMNQSVGTGMVVSLFPDHERGKAIGAQTTAVAIGGASGPIIGGLVLQVLPWEALFIGLTVPIAIGFVAALVLLDEESVSRGVEENRSPFDWVGAVTSAIGIIVLVLAINNPFEIDWVSPLMGGAVVLLIAIFGFYVRWENRVEDPMLDLSLFTIADFRRSVGARVIGFMSATAGSFLIPIYLISLRGWSAALAGAVLLVRSVGMGISAPISGRWSDRIGTRPFNIVGFSMLVVSTAGTLAFSRGTPAWFIIAVLFVAGLSHGLWNVPNNANIISAVPPARYGVIGAFTNLTRNAGNVFGQAITSAIVVSVMVSKGFDVPLSDIDTSVGAGDAFVAGWRWAFGAALAFGVIGLWFAWRTDP